MFITTAAAWVVFPFPGAMKRRFAVAPRVLFWFIGFSLLGFTTAGSSLAQLNDDVHVVPRPQTHSRGEAVPLDSLRGTKPMRVDVDLVTVPVTVNDSFNRPVISLTKKDFSLSEEDKPQEIRYFSAEEAPISVAILLDVSKSMSDKIDTERAAVVEFFKNANPDDEYVAITFAGQPRTLVNSTQSADEVERELIAVEPGGPTAMLDAIYLALSKLHNARHQRKAIVIFSDGGDNASRYSLREVKSLIQESDVQIYAIGLFETFFFNTLEEKMGKKWLSEITDVTGGRTITVDNRAKVPEAAATLSREMRNQYLLGYKPETPPSTGWRKIKVRVNSQAEPTLRAHYKQGYRVY